VGPYNGVYISSVDIGNHLVANYQCKKRSCCVRSQDSRSGGRVIPPYKSTAIYLAFLSTLLSLVISMTGRSERSARALRDGADVVREAIGNHFCVRICYMFLTSKCRGVSNLGVCTTSGLAFGKHRRSGDFRKKTCFDAGKIGI